jgi:hypothetical protein
MDRRNTIYVVKFPPPPSISTCKNNKQIRDYDMFSVALTDVEDS